MADLTDDELTKVERASPPFLREMMARLVAEVRRRRAAPQPQGAQQPQATGTHHEMVLGEQVGTEQK